MNQSRLITNARMVNGEVSYHDGQSRGEARGRRLEFER